jgi:hypothetical protein
MAMLNNQMVYHPFKGKIMAKLVISGYFMVNMVSSFGVYRRFTAPVRILKLKRVGSNFGGSKMTFQYKLCMLADVERDEHVPGIPGTQHFASTAWVFGTSVGIKMFSQSSPMIHCAVAPSNGSESKCVW